MKNRLYYCATCDRKMEPVTDVNVHRCDGCGFEIVDIFKTDESAQKRKAVIDRYIDDVFNAAFGGLNEKI
jgi:DNA-directed RNA polymerase subunit RPC12/RpoP